MTRTTNARIAGFTFLFYIAAGVASMILFGKATSGEDIAAKLAGIAQHATFVRITVLLGLSTCFCAIVLGVTLYSITREQDRDLAMLAMICRVCEGVVGGVAIRNTLGVLWLGTGTGAEALNTESAQALGAFLLDGQGWGTSASFFAVGSTLFCWLFLRGRMIPVALARLGVLASILLVVCCPLQLAGFLHGTIAWLIWIPMAAFEVPLAVWFLLKGVAMPGGARAQAY